MALYDAVNDAGIKPENPPLAGTSPAKRRTEEGLSHREIVRCIKRYLARGLFPILIADLAELT